GCHGRRPRSARPRRAGHPVSARCRHRQQGVGLDRYHRLRIRAVAAARRPRLHRNVPRSGRAGARRISGVRSARAGRSAAHLLSGIRSRDTAARAPSRKHQMNLLEALFLGVIQGLTEFLPISSSAHLRIVGELLPSGADPGAAFTAITQIGTEAAVVVFFWRDIVRIVGQWFRSLIGKVARNDPDARMGWLIILGSIPIVVLGLVFQDKIETTLRSLWIVAIML